MLSAQPRILVIPLVLLLACGRIDYEPRSDAAQDGLDASTSDGATIGDASDDAASDDAAMGDAARGDGALTDGGAIDSGDSDAGPPPETLTVQPTYPLHAEWNAYVAPTAPMLDPDHQPDVDCSITDPINGVPCIHGGERRRVETTRASCDGLTLRDDLDAFVWRCDASGGQAVFFSRGLADGRGLADLLEADGSGFRPMRVTLLDGMAAVETSAPAVWWPNPVRTVAPGADMLTNELPSVGTIFVVTSDMMVRGLVLGSDRMALVTLGSAAVSFDAGAGVPLNCAAVMGGNVDAHCLLRGEGRSFMWIEGSYRGVRALSTLRGIVLRQVRNSRLHRVRVRDTGSHGLHLSSLHESRIVDLHQENTGAEGVYVAGCHFNRWMRLRIARASASGLRVSMSGHNVFSDIRASNAAYAGIQNGCGGSYNVYTHVVVASNGAYGIESPCNSRTTLSHVTAIGNRIGIEFYRDPYRVLVQAVIAGNEAGLEVEGGLSRFAQIVATDNSAIGVYVPSGGNAFSGALIVGNNGGGDCSVTVPNGGLINGTCTVSGTDGSSDYGAQPSTAILRTGRSVLSAFEGRVSSDDPVNDSDMNGFAATVTNWTHFANPYRAWGREGATLAWGSCASNCRIWDWRLAGGPSVLRDTVLDGTTVVTPRASAPCPAWVRGDVTMTDFLDREIVGDGSGDEDGFCEGAEACHPPNTFLMNALEVLGDERGDEDSLCETGETCIASPHFGAWQGDGEPISACTFDSGPGPISDVTMLVR